MSKYGIENFYIELIEEYPCDNKEQLSKREGHFIREIATINERVAGYDTNERKRNRYHVTPEVREKSIQATRKWRSEHKEEQAEYFKTYYKQHREEIQKNKQEIIVCRCGATYQKAGKARHERRKHHQRYILEHQLSSSSDSSSSLLCS